MLLAKYVIDLPQCSEGRFFLNEYFINSFAVLSYFVDTS